VPFHVARQLRLEHARRSNKDYDLNWTLLNDWGKEFVKRNPGSVFDIKTDPKTNQFTKLFLGIGAAARIALRTWIDFSGIDGTWFKHMFFRGIALLLVTRDGDNRLLLMAIVICLGENASNWKWFAEKCSEMPDVTEYLNREKGILYSDRHKGIPAFERFFKAYSALCLVHLIENCRDHVRKLKKTNPFADPGFAAEVSDTDTICILYSVISRELSRHKRDITRITAICL